MPAILRIVLGRPPTVGVFFSVGLAVFQPSDLIGDLNELGGQFLKTMVVGYLGLGFFSLVSRNAFGALGTSQIALQNVIGTLPGGFALSLLDEELLTQGAASEPIDGLDFLKDLLALAMEFGQCCFHGGYIVSI